MDWKIAIKRIRNNILVKLLSFIQIFTKKDAYILIDDLFEEEAECIDTYSLFVYMREHHIPVYYTVWKRNYFYERLKKEKKLNHVIVVKKQFGTDFIKRAFFPLLRTKVIVSGFLNWGDFTEGRKFVQEWISKNKYTTHVYINHGVTFFKRDVLSGYAPKWFDKLLVSNDIEKEIFIKGAAWDAKDIIKVGLPRWDMLKRQSHNEKTIFVFFTFRKTFARCKNFRDFEYYKKIVSLFNNAELNSLLKESNVKMIYGVHHAILCQQHLDWKFECKNIEIADARKLSHYIGKTDLFITDYSSIVFDFMFLDIPVIFYKIDFNDRKLLNQDKVSMCKFDQCAPYLYNCVNTETELIQKIKHYIQNNFVIEEENKQKNRRFFHTKEEIARQLCEELDKL